VGDSTLTTKTAYYLVEYVYQNERIDEMLESWALWFATKPSTATAEEYLEGGGDGE
jgi:hypothetical protein